MLPPTGGAIWPPMENATYANRTLCHWTHSNPDPGSTAVFKAPEVTATS